MWVYGKVPRWWAGKAGKKVVTTRWIDVNKGDETNEDYRSRLVAKDFKNKNDQREDLFAGAPPLEALKFILSRAATRRRGRERERER